MLIQIWLYFDERNQPYFTVQLEGETLDVASRDFCHVGPRATPTDVRSENRNRMRSPDLGLMKNMQQCTVYVYIKMIGPLIIRI